MVVGLRQDEPIDMSLRLWSDHVPLKAFLDEMDIVVKHLHVRGELKISEGRFSKSIADRHYASVANFRGRSNDDVAIWIQNILDIIRKNASLLAKIRDNFVWGLIWIAIMPKGSLNIPPVDEFLINEIHRLGLKLMIENYNDFDEDGNPKKIWL